MIDTNLECRFTGVNIVEGDIRSEEQTYRAILSVNFHKKNKTEVFFTKDVVFEGLKLSELGLENLQLKLYEYFL